MGELMEPLGPSTRIYVAGRRGLAGSAFVRALTARGCRRIDGATSADLDLRDRAATFAHLEQSDPDVVILAAARVGGIAANSSYPVDFLSDNLRIQCNVMDAAAALRVPRLLFLGSSCIYPKFAPQPITEDALLTGPLEPTNDAYAIAKIAGIMQVKAVRRQYGLSWISAMPTNLYGPNDNFAAETSHLLPALIRRYEHAVACGAGSVTNWGTGRPRREMMHVDDMADACLTLLDAYDGDEHVNVGTGVDHTIAEIAGLVADRSGFNGEVHWDTDRSDGTPRKVLDVSRLASLGWSARIPLADGIAETIDWFRAQSGALRE
ncbi:GDP-L-fucose synthase [Gordonia sp. PDNC005]|uniref:GDP-L-fucose synthase family protein n=1 Tax=Gordonia sp. PDNC005 TaxID=2811424 RepID=UPI00196572D7|nr:GDP-L-fucose synthase [Gordonia sp. PDNC005]QRY64736.1 GDP-L-fucose synthase [Gordonia sp. PDNC005]